MSGQWDFLITFKNDIDELFEEMKKSLDQFSSQEMKVFASIADEKGDPAKSVIFYSHINNAPEIINNSSWRSCTFKTKASGHDQARYTSDLFNPIKEILNTLEHRSAFAARVFLTDCDGGSATATLIYPTEFIEKKPEPKGIWGYSCFFNRSLESVANSAVNNINTIAPDFSLAAASDEDGNDAKTVVYQKTGLHTNKLHRGKTWKYRVYRTRADGTEVSTYKVELFDKIKSDLSTLTDAQALAAQIILTDRSEGKATISIFYPEIPIPSIAD